MSAQRAEQSIQGLAPNHRHGREAERLEQAPRKHLLSREDIARAAAGSGDIDLTRAPGQGNGMRVHLVTFGLASLAVLALVIGAIALASRMM